MLYLLRSVLLVSLIAGGTPAFFFVYLCSCGGYTKVLLLQVLNLCDLDALRAILPKNTTSERKMCFIFIGLADCTALQHEHNYVISSALYIILLFVYIPRHCTLHYTIHPSFNIFCLGYGSSWSSTKTAGSTLYIQLYVMRCLCSKRTQN